ncbi:hypothetical protein BO83DRAFT_394038 [Aspergillus eucalypticola CBS 122712]|uniref:Uncharacterized protein n=1 Tax=Aspergillus eucalypticola (strain CBS 122712 / IBT 29274) TaxID=1448314 RepID=A0A317UPQ7_ASPEC|nr:uncharacterized protein BO83DRAFT_394038 [Aspergillus eucalypticola CBS 122712]PWY62422.1 hypothetical protein BO83DRAFT_394038 [Aspergillus eucalypticola CBS 122712]
MDCDTRCSDLTLVYPILLKLTPDRSRLCEGPIPDGLSNLDRTCSSLECHPGLDAVFPPLHAARTFPKRKSQFCICSFPAGVCIPRRRSFPVSASSDLMNMLLGLAKNTQPTTQASSKREMLCAFHPSFFSSPFLATIGPSSSFICPPVSMPGAAVMPRGDMTKSEYLHSGRPSWRKHKECHPAEKRGESADRETDGGWGLHMQIDNSVSSWSRFLPYGEFSLAVTRMGG